jgi:hypothetical protein
MKIFIGKRFGKAVALTLLKIIFYMTLLCDIFKKYGSDKAPMWIMVSHNYSPFYDSLFSHRRNDVKKVLELGVGFADTMPSAAFIPYTTGASLFGWKEYFPNAEIHAIDIREDTMITWQDRIHTYVCDQSKPEELLTLVDKIGGDFDFICDDGSHDPGHQLISAVTLTPFLKEGGVYAIEDIKEPEKLMVALRNAGIAISELHRFNRNAADDNIILIRK